MGIYSEVFGDNGIAGFIKIIVTILMHIISLSTHHHLGWLCFACLDALVPRVLECCVASCPAVSEPRTATSAATEFAGFRDGATCEAYGSNGLRRGS